MIERLPRLDVTRLAADFSAAVRAAHSEAELQAIRDRNAAEIDPAVDHVHDFTDANDLMADAIDQQWKGLADFTESDWSWSDFSDEIETAWNRAKSAGFHLCRILVGCEFSGTVRDAFIERGHSVLSCDLLETEAPGPHYQGDVRDIINDGWHLGIFHPSCTNLTNAGVKHLVRGGQHINPERWIAMERDAEFFRDIEAAPIERIARENPIMHCYAREIVGRKADQYIQPNRYGHDVSKKTGLWLKDLPKLLDDPADHIAPRLIEYKGKIVKRWSNQSPCGADSRGPSATRGHDRSVFFSGIANAMADQWGGIMAKLRAPAGASVTQLELAL